MIGAVGRRRLRTGIVVAVVVAVASAVRLAVLQQTGGLLASEQYDDGVHYAAAAAFVHGRWPYADFVFLQPPAVVVALAPFAALGAWLGDPVGVVAARLVWIGLGAAGCGLVAVLAGRRSWTGGLVGGAAAACFYPLAYGERSTLLEPLATVLLLTALLVRERGGGRAALVAGVLAGVSVDVKIWYVVPVLVLAAFPAHRLRFLAGAFAGGALVVLPFLIRSPDALVRQVFLDQLGRPRLPEDTTLQRLGVLTGALYTRSERGVEASEVLPIAVAVAALVVLAAVAAVRSPLGRRAVALLAATVAVLLAGPSFFLHYAALSGPWTALVVGVGAGTALARLPWRALRAGAAVLLAVVAAAPTLPVVMRPADPPRDYAPVARAAAAAGCVRSDDPGLLAAIGVLSRDLRNGCALWPDVTGRTFDRPGFPVVSTDRPASAAWQRSVGGYLLGGSAVIADREGTGLSPATLRRIRALPVLARSGDLVLHAVPR